jgi:hypothetical protein
MAAVQPDMRSSGNRPVPVCDNTTGRVSTDADGLPLGLDDGHDALLFSGVGRAGVLRGQLVDDLPCCLALDPFDDSSTDDDGLEWLSIGAMDSALPESGST